MACIVCLLDKYAKSARLDAGVQVWKPRSGFTPRPGGVERVLGGLTQQRMIASDSDIWRGLFSATRERVVVIQKRIADPSEARRCKSVTSDASPTRPSATNWKRLEYAAMDSQTILTPFQKKYVDKLTIQHPERDVCIMGVA